MPAFTKDQHDAISESYFVAQDWIEHLTQANQRQESDVRRSQIIDFEGHRQQLESLRFFEKEDFTQPELDAIVRVSSEITDLATYIDNQNDLVLIELETDLAMLVQKLPLDELSGILKLSWLGEKRNYTALPATIPDEVRDAFDVGVLVRAQVRLNQIAQRVREVNAEKCLNQDDYSSRWFQGVQINAATSAGQYVCKEYVSLLKTRKAADAAAALAAANTPSLGGQIWSVIGWDSPWDFAKDVVLSVVPGYKAVRWARRLGKARKVAARAQKYIDKIHDFQQNIRKAEERIEKIQDAAKKLRQLKALSNLPNKIRAAFKRLEAAEEQVKLLQNLGSSVKRDYLRGVVTTVTADAAANRRLGNVPEAAVLEAARTAITDWLLTTPLFKRVAELREILGWTALMQRQSRGDLDNLIAEYVVKAWLLEFMVRFCLRTFSNLDVSNKALVEELIAASGAAIERMLRDIPILPGHVATETGRWVTSIVRKLGVELAQKIVDKLLE